MKKIKLLVSMRFFVFLSLAFSASTSFAAFSVNYDGFNVVVVDKNNKPLPSYRIYYGVIAEKYGVCGGRRGSPLDFGKPCKITFNPEGDSGGQFVVTDRNGRAKIPAFSSFSRDLTSRNPFLFVEPKGIHIPLKTSNGIYGCMTESIPTEWIKSVEGEIDEEVSRVLSREGLKIVYSWDADFTMEEFYEYAAKKAADGYAEYGNDYLQTYCTEY